MKNKASRFKEKREALILGNTSQAYQYFRRDFAILFLKENSKNTVQEFLDALAAKLLIISVVDLDHGQVGKAKVVVKIVLGDAIDHTQVTMIRHEDIGIRVEIRVDVEFKNLDCKRIYNRVGFLIGSPGRIPLILILVDEVDIAPLQRDICSRFIGHLDSQTEEHISFPGGENQISTWMHLEWLFNVNHLDFKIGVLN